MESLQDKALTLIERVRADPGAANADALDSFRNASADHESAVQWAEDYLELLPRMRERSFSRAEQRRIRLEAWWARLWEPPRIGLTAAVVSVAIVLGSVSLHLLAPEKGSRVAASEPQLAIEEHSTRREHREIALEDGSFLWLDWNSAATIEFAATDRRVILHSGRAAFAVTPDVGRPFHVVAGDLVARVTGTEFVVDRRKADEVEVAVLEGAVTVAANGSQLSLQASEIAGMAGSTLSLKSDADIAALDAWRDGRLVLRSATLAEAFDALQPYTRFTVDATQLAGFSNRVSGTYFLNRADDAILGLIQAHRLEVEQHNWDLILSPPRPTRPTFP
ncbi:MAG: FecR domain-containing protein [Pseudomonadota bacterium]